MLSRLLFLHESDKAEVEFLASLFPPAYRQQVGRIWRSGNWPMRIFVIGSLMVLLASPTSGPDIFDHGARVASFSGHTRADVANRWAQMGFCSDGSTGAKCGHCNFHSGSLQPDPANWHSEQRPDCPLLQLHRILSASEVPPFAEIAPYAMGFKAMIRDLFDDLRDPVTRLVESFGFSSAAVAIAMLAFRLAKGSHRETPRPGDLIRIIQSRSHANTNLFGRLLSMSRRLFDDVLPVSSPRDNTPLPCELLPSHLVDLSDFRGIADRPRPSLIERRMDQQLLTSLQSNHRPMQSPSRIPTPRPTTLCSVPEAEKREETSDCTVCHLRSRDRVLLPCAHLVACHVCVQDMASCPKCGGNILAMVTAFIS